MNNIIETERLIIRRFESKDADDFAEILTDKDVVYFEPYDVFTEENAKKEAVKLSENESFYAVVLKAENKLIGKLYFNNENNFDTYEIGYTFNAHYQGKGYAYESAYALMKYSFLNMNVRRIIAYCDTENIRSWKLLEKLGMRREGIHIKTFYKFMDSENNPIWKNSYSYALLKEEFDFKE